MNFCAIDFGTSNSSVAIAQPRGGSALVPLEDGQTNVPTGVFYFTDESEAALARHVQRPVGALPRAYGRAAIEAYVHGHAGRLMRSLKSILGSSLAEQATDLGDGHAVRYLDVITGYLRHLRAIGQQAAGQELERVVVGRPVFFVDGDPRRDSLAEATLRQAALAAGFSEVQFQFEPIAAAFDYEQTVQNEQRVLVADIGGGTSDFSLVRVGPKRAALTQRRQDILANYGVHVAGTNFDRQIELAAILPLAGYRTRGPAQGGAREVPHSIYHDLATWHLINTCYRPQRVAEWQAMAEWFDQPALHSRLMRILRQRLGHELAARSEAAKIEAAAGQATQVALDMLEPDLYATVDEELALTAIRHELGLIVQAALETVRLAGLRATDVDAVYFTGGSTGLRPLTERLAAQFPSAKAVQGDRLGSVAQGLGVHARRLFAPG